MSSKEADRISAAQQTLDSMLSKLHMRRITTLMNAVHSPL